MNFISNWCSPQIEKYCFYCYVIHNYYLNPGAKSMSRWRAVVEGIYTVETEIYTTTTTRTTKQCQIKTSMGLFFFSQRNFCLRKNLYTYVYIYGFLTFFYSSFPFSFRSIILVFLFLARTLEPLITQYTSLRWNHII
jgi:hypothetical protein